MKFYVYLFSLAICLVYTLARRIKRQNESENKTQDDSTHKHHSDPTHKHNSNLTKLPDPTLELSPKFNTIWNKILGELKKYKSNTNASNCCKPNCACPSCKPNVCLSKWSKRYFMKQFYKLEKVERMLRRQMRTVKKQVKNLFREAKKNEQASQ